MPGVAVSSLDADDRFRVLRPAAILLWLRGLLLRASCMWWASSVDDLLGVAALAAL